MRIGTCDDSNTVPMRTVNGGGPDFDLRAYTAVWDRLIPDEERRYAAGERILRQGISGSAFYIILDGEAAIRVSGKDYGTLGRGEFFGEISALLGDPPVADIVALRTLRCAIIAGPDIEGFMLSHPTVLYRMLKSEARKLQGATSWRT